MKATAVRLPITEYQSTAFLTDAAHSSGLSTDDLLGLLLSASRRLRRLLALESEPITVDGDYIKVVDIAGLVRLAPNIELEVAPKFLGHTSPRWREDFVRIVGLTREGKLLPADAILAGFGRKNDLAGLLGEALLEQYQVARRWPLRTYRNRVWDDFDVDGDVDAESVVLPSEEGFKQEKMTLDRANIFNSVISAAARILLTEVADADVQRRLQFMLADIGPESPPPAQLERAERLPARHRRWQGALTLSLAVVRGFGTDFAHQDSTVPGFVVKTWKGWEDLVSRALQTGMTGKVVLKRKHVLGVRNSTENVLVEPDLTITTDPLLLADAKYRTRIDKARPAIDAGDLYESLAFLDAAESGTMVLIYPMLETEPFVGCGAHRMFQVVERGDGRRVVGLMVECRGISEPGGFTQFATALAGAVGAAAGGAAVAA